MQLNMHHHSVLLLPKPLPSLLPIHWMRVEEHNHPVLLLLLVFLQFLQFIRCVLIEEIILCYVLCCAMTILLSPVTSVEVHDHSVLCLPWHCVCCSSPCCCFRVVDNGRLRRITKVRIDGMMIENKKMRLLFVQRDQLQVVHRLRTLQEHFLCSRFQGMSLNWRGDDWT